MTATPSFCNALRAYLTEALPSLPVLPSVSTGEVNPAAPYAVLTATAEQELVRGNHTWELGITLELHANAHETGSGEQQALFHSLCAAVQNPTLADRLNEAAEDFYLYSFSLQGVDEPLVQDNTFIQAARCRAVIQF